MMCTFDELAAIAEAAPPPPPVYACPVCGKLGNFPDRKSARKARRRYFPGEHMRAYECDVPGRWHFGHLPVHVMSPPVEAPVQRVPSTVLAGIALVARATHQETA